MNQIQIIRDSTNRNYILLNPSSTSSIETYNFINILSNRYENLFFDVFYGGIIYKGGISLVPPSAEEGSEKVKDISMLLVEKIKSGEINNFASVLSKCSTSPKKKKNSSLPSEKYPGCQPNVYYHWVENRTFCESRDLMYLLILEKFSKIREKLISLYSSKKEGKTIKRNDVLKVIREEFGNLFEEIINEIINKKIKSEPVLNDYFAIVRNLKSFRDVCPDRWKIALKVIDRDLIFHKTNSKEFSLDYSLLLDEKESLQPFINKYYLYIYDLNLISSIENFYFNRVTRGNPLICENIVCYNDHRYNSVLIRYLTQLERECFSGESPEIENTIIGDTLINDFEVLDELFSPAVEEKIINGCPLLEKK